MKNHRRSRAAAAAALTLLALAGSAQALVETVLIPSDSASPDQFGNRVALSGDVAVISAFLGRRPSGINRGTAYVFRDGAGGWIEEQELVPADNASWLSAPVGASGDVAIVGAPSADAAYLFRFNGTSWVQEAKLSNPDPTVDDFGAAVGISGNVVVIGAPASPVSQPGAAFVYRWNGAAWLLEATLRASDQAPNDRFGFAVAVEGGVAVVGASFDDTHVSDGGSAYIYRFNGASWVEEAHLVGDSSINASDNLGEAVGISGDLIVAAAPDGFGTRGVVFVYRRVAGVWGIEGILRASDFSVNARFGNDVAVSGNRIVAACRARNALYVFEYGPVPFSIPWTQIEKIVDSSIGVGDAYGSDVALDGLAILTGDPQHELPTPGDREGAAYVYAFADCGNGIDDDLDGFVDAADIGCVGTSDSSEREIGLVCDDEIDDDFDAAAAFPEDPGCSGPGDSSERDPALACDNQVDEDGDGDVSFPFDQGCSGPGDPTETDPAVACDDGADNDSDGNVDYPADPGCWNTTHWIENPKCQNGIDDDGQNGLDFDGGASVNGGVPIGPPDPSCGGLPYVGGEPGGCGLGFELAPLIAGLQLLRRRRRTPAA